MSKRQKWLLAGCIVVLFAIAVCTLPFPARVSRTMQAVIVSQDNQVSEPFTMTLSGWHLHYLFKLDSLDLDADVRKDLTGLTYVEVVGPILEKLSEEYCISSYMAYSIPRTGYTGGYFAMTPDSSSCCFYLDDGKYLLASAEEGFDWERLLEDYRPLLK